MQDPSKTLARGWILAAVVLALAALAPTQGPHLRQARGAVEIGVGEPPAWKAARSGDAIGAGDSVRTGPGAGAELVLGTRTVRLYENSVLRIPAQAAAGTGPRAVDLSRGRGLFDVLRKKGGDRFDVRTPEVVVSVKGTRFLVDAGGDTVGASVSVFRGEVGVRALAQELAHEVRVRPGFTALGGVGGAMELELTPFDDPWQGWSSGAPAPRPAAAVRPSLPAGKAALRDAKAAAERLVEKEMKGPGAAAPPAKGDLHPAVDRTRPSGAKKGAASRPRPGMLPGAHPPAEMAPPTGIYSPGGPAGDLTPSFPPPGSNLPKELRPGGLPGDFGSANGGTTNPTLP